MSVSSKGRGSFLERVSRLFLDCIYPPACVSCGSRGSWWCEACRDSVERLTIDPCPRCLSTDADHERESCSGTLPFASVVATGFYHAPPLRTFLASVKYHGVTAAEADLKAYLEGIPSFRQSPFPWDGEGEIAIQAAPLAAKRERERGFNQARWIAESLHDTWLPSAPLISILDRAASITTQATIDDPDVRSANVRGSFVATKSVSGSVLLVDDVVTTGSTAAEAAYALLSAGATRVHLFTLALGK